jgi:NAD(P)-dependent dehydrogenase (short-subunit alcohol dehydrogenase family)
MSKLTVATFTNIGYLIHARRFEPIQADLSGRVAVVTGANAGLGLETSRRLAAYGAHVVMVGRNKDKLQKASESIEGTTSIAVADLSLLAEIRQLANRLRQERVDILINNVGVLLPDRRVTEEGLEATFATDLAGHFLLTNLLLPRLVASAPARVINVSSGGMYSARIDPDDLQFERRPYTGTATYASAKRGQVILTEMWAERYPGLDVTFHSMHPGWARTEGVARSLPTFNTIMKPLLRTPEQGADTIVWLAVAEEPGETSGQFWFDRSVAPIHLTESTREAAEDRAQLWQRLTEAVDLGGAGPASS